MLCLTILDQAAKTWMDYVNCLEMGLLWDVHGKTVKMTVILTKNGRSTLMYLMPFKKRRASEGWWMHDDERDTN